MINILILLFIIRPIIDLFWNIKFGPTNLAGLIAMVISLLIYLTFFLVLKRKKMVISKITIVLLIYCVLITLFTFNVLSDFDNLFRIISSTIFIFILSKNINEEVFDKTIKWFIIVTIIPIIIAYLQAIGIVEYTYWDYFPSGMIGRASGGYRQPSVLTRFLTFGNLYCLYFISKYKYKKKVKFYCVSYLIISSIAIFLSYHRTGYFINVILIAIYFCIIHKNRFIDGVLKIIITIIIGIFIIVGINNLNLISITANDFFALVDFNNIVKIDNGELNLVLRGRGGILDNLIYYIQNSPWYYTLLGNGVSINNITGFNMNIADMDFIRILWNYGIIGIMIWSAQIIIFINNAIKCNNKNLKLLGICTMLIYIIFGFTIEATTTPNFMYHVYFIIGYIISIKIKTKEIII